MTGCNMKEGNKAMAKRVYVFVIWRGVASGRIYSVI